MRLSQRSNALITTTRPTKSPRPLSLTIVGIWLIVGGAISVFDLASVSNPVVQSTWVILGISPFLYVTTTLLTGTANLIAGVGILRGKRWGRTLYLVFGLAGNVMSVVVYRSGLPMVVFGLLFYGAFAFLLTREPARAYFAGTYEVPPALQERRRVLASLRERQRNASDLKRVFGVIFAVGAAFLIHTTLFIFGFVEGMIAVIVAAFFGIPAIIAFAIGVVLWGRTRWAGFSGWTLAGGGASSALTSLMIAFVQRTEIWEAAMAQSEQAVELDAGFLIRLSLQGLLIGLIGAALLYRQHQADQTAADLILEERVPVETL